MVFGIVGAHAIGKTTFVMDFVRRNAWIPRMRYIHGDLTTDNYPLAPEYAESRFYRKLEYKRSMLTDMIQDRETFWIVEGCRFWGSMFHHVAPIKEDMNGGLFMLIVTTTADIMLANMKARAIVNNRALKTDYWTREKLEYEAKHRHVNACTKNLKSADWMTVEFLGDFSIWMKVPNTLLFEFATDRSLWYERFPVTIERRPVI